MNNDFAIPPGYVMDAKGDLRKEENLSDLERAEDKLVKSLFPRAKALYQDIGRFKHDAMHMIEDTISTCIKEYNIKRFEKIKGNVSFTTVDGKLKVERAINDKIEANSGVEAARQIFEQYASVLETQSGEDAKEFIRSYFKLNKDQYVTSNLIDLCNKNVSHPLYKQARAALQEALFVSSSKAYVRFYVRNENDDSWEPMPLQFSSIPAIPPEADTPCEA
jgi:hypothetical protein